MKKSFDEIVLFARTGLNPRTNFKLGKGTNKYITIKNIHNNTILIDENTDVLDDDAIKLIHKRSQIKKGDILFCSIGRMGDMYIIPEEPVGWDINESVFAFTLNTDIIRQKYFYYIFKNHNTIEFLSKNSSGSTFKSIKMNQLKRMFFDIPTLNEQDKIISVLDNVCKTIELRKQQLQQLDELVKARFVELFGDPFDTRKWTVKTLKDVSESMVDGSNINPDYYETKGEVLFLRIQNVWRNEFRLDDSVYITQEINRKHYYDTSLKTGDLLITKIGRYYTKDSSLGRVSVYRGNDDCANYSNNIMRVRLNDTMNSEFVNSLLNLDDYRSYIKRTSKGGTDKRALSKSLIGSYPIIIPPKSLQDEFADFVKQIDKSKFVVQKALDESQTLFDSLMQEYFG